MPKSKRPKVEKDHVLVVGRAKEGAGVAVLRRRRDRVEAGWMAPAPEGKAVQGELVQLKATEAPLLYEAETVYDGAHRPSGASPAAAATPAGPAKVATKSYRKNWDKVFRRSKPRRGRELLN